MLTYVLINLQLVQRIRAAQGTSACAEVTPEPTDNSGVVGAWATLVPCGKSQVDEKWGNDAPGKRGMPTWAKDHQ
jgi:hypothetical protein